MKPTTLSERMNAALYGANPDEIAVRKAKIKAELDRAKTLVDAGLLGSIIITELLAADGSQLSMRPYGDPEIVLQTAKQLLLRGMEAAQAVQPEPAPSEPHPS